MDDKRVAKLAKSLLAKRGTPAERIREAIDQIDLLPNLPSAWIGAHGGNKKLAGKNGKKIKQISEELREILASMPNAIVYNVYLNKKYSFDDALELVKFMERRGYKHTGFSGGGVLADLRGQPQFDGMAGPMSDGGGKVRYETFETYNQLSV